MNEPEKIDPRELSPLALAFVGDSVLELLVRQRLVEHHRLEKLYEELLVKTEELDKTENDLIFREKDRPLSVEQIREKLRMLKDVCDNGDDDQAREVLRKVVPTFKRPEEVNKEVGAEVEPEDNSLPQRRVRA